MLRPKNESLQRQVGIVLKNERDACRLTQREAAHEIGVTINTLMHYEAGRSNIGVTELFALCDVYEIDVVDVVARIKDLGGIKP